MISKGDIGGGHGGANLDSKSFAGTKAALRVRAEQRHRSVEAEAREVLTEALEREPVTLVDLLSMDDGDDIDFEAERLGRTAPTAEL